MPDDLGEAEREIMRRMEEMFNLKIDENIRAAYQHKKPTRLHLDFKPAELQKRAITFDD